MFISFLLSIFLNFYLEGNGGRRQLLRRKVSVDVDGPGLEATTAGRPDSIADPAESFRLDRDCCRPSLIVQVVVEEVEGNWPARKPSQAHLQGDVEGKNWAYPIQDVVVVARKVV